MYEKMEMNINGNIINYTRKYNEHKKWKQNKKTSMSHIPLRQ